jgi:hypothetical protein
MVNSTSKDESWGSLQLISIYSATQQDFKLCGWSKAMNISGTSDTGYSLHVDILFQDDTVHYGKEVSFSTGTHNWEKKCALYKTKKTAKAVVVYMNFYGHQGIAWFDDITFYVVGPTDIEEEESVMIFDAESSVSKGCCPKRRTILATEKSVSISHTSIPNYSFLLQ